jgi:phosphatidylglycerol---prolipoprotein diacylglyceryl transferase
MDHSLIGIIFTLLAYVAGGICFWKVLRHREFAPRDLSWILFAALVGGIFGAKVTALALGLLHGASPAALLAHPDGRSIIGGILFGWLAVEFAKKRLNITRSTGDGFAFALCIGEAFGRIGCFFNGCCYGEVCSLPWAVFQHNALRHPTQIYAVFIALAVLAILFFAKDKVRYEGDLFRIYLLCYGLSRFVLEFFRVRSEIYFGLSVAQWVSLEIVAAMIFAIIFAYRGKHTTQGEGTQNEAV